MRWIGTWAAGVLMGCAQSADSNNTAPVDTDTPGQPLAGLSVSEMTRFRAGEGLFNTVYRDTEGLGPAFNENQCSACHTDPASGGVGGERITRASRFDSAGGCDAMLDLGGDNIRRKLTAALVARGMVPEQLPPGTTVGLFTAPALFGLGLVEAIPDSVLLMRHDPDDTNGDGISGRVGRTADGRLARFGRKADVATVTDFVVSALRGEMGLTTSASLGDRMHGQAAEAGLDTTPDPEVNDQALARLADYVRFLAPMARGAAPRPWTERDVQDGERLFASAGCTGCHVPQLATGTHTTAALHHRTLALYSDLLLHDMGPALADVCSVAASPAEVRTEPLIGLRYRELLLHDGRATSVEDAIRFHGGEATTAAAAFAKLSLRERTQLLAFLGTL